LHALRESSRKRLTVWHTRKACGASGADMTRYLLDTNSVIYFFNGEEKVAQIIESLDSEIYVSFISKLSFCALIPAIKVLRKKSGSFLMK
jgi:hypothetical protein